MKDSRKLDPEAVLFVANFWDTVKDKDQKVNASC